MNESETEGAGPRAVKQADNEQEIVWRDPDDETNYIRKNKCVRLIRLTDDYIVFLDPGLGVEWTTSRRMDACISSPDFNGILAEAARIESIPADKQPEEAQRNFKRMIGEGIACAMEGANEAAKRMLIEAERYILERNLELSRYWSLRASGLATAVAAGTGLLLWLTRDWSLAMLGSEKAFYLLLSFFAGSLGAFLSIIMRTGSIRTDCNAGAPLHWLEGCLKIAAGCISGLLAAAFVLLDLVLPVFGKTRQTWLAMLVISIVAGASERWAPSIIAKMEADPDAATPPAP